MNKFVIGLGLGISIMMATSVFAQEATPACSVNGSDMTAFAALDYDAFNYGPDGWRSLSSKKCFYDAGASIVSWLVDHEGDLNGAQLRTQHYQAARNFALAGRKSIALLQLRMAQDNAPAKLGEMDWNGYLAAFNAWLSEDKTALDLAIERLKKQTKGSDGHKPNLDAALRFDRCFSKSYIMIEQDPACIATPPSE